MWRGGDLLVFWILPSTISAIVWRGAYSSSDIRRIHNKKVIFMLKYKYMKNCYFDVKNTVPAN